MTRIDIPLLLKLFVAFIIATVVGTVSHELGHYLVAKSYGYNASIDYATTYWVPTDTNEVVPRKNVLLITLGGPIQTLLTGTFGLILLFFQRKQFYSAERLTLKQWAIIFMVLFWLRQTANFVTWSAAYLIMGFYSENGDEVQIANYLNLPPLSVLMTTGLIGIVILAVVVFKFVPIRQRLTFLISGFTGGIAGYILWLELFGQYILP